MIRVISSGVVRGYIQSPDPVGVLIVRFDGRVAAILENVEPVDDVGEVGWQGNWGSWGGSGGLGRLFGQRSSENRAARRKRGRRNCAEHLPRAIEQSTQPGSRSALTQAGLRASSVWLARGTST